MLWLNSWVENPKNRDHLRSRSVINEIETRSGVIESTFFFTPTSPNCYFSLHNQRADLNKRPVRDGLEYKHSIYVVVGISNSVLSILTANFPVRIEKRSLHEFFQY